MQSEILDDRIIYYKDNIKYFEVLNDKKIAYYKSGKVRAVINKEDPYVITYDENGDVKSEMYKYFKDVGKYNPRWDKYGCRYFNKDSYCEYYLFLRKEDKEYENSGYDNIGDFEYNDDLLSLINEFGLDKCIKHFVREQDIEYIIQYGTINLMGISYRKGPSCVVYSNDKIIREEYTYPFAFDINEGYDYVDDDIGPGIIKYNQQGDVIKEKYYLGGRCIVNRRLVNNELRSYPTSYYCYEDERYDITYSDSEDENEVSDDLYIDNNIDEDNQSDEVSDELYIDNNIDKDDENINSDCLLQ